MKPARLLLLLAAVASAVLPGIARSNTPVSLVMAGVGIADATWHAGVGSGQYTEKDPNVLNLATGGEIDPHSHSITQRHSYGVHSRLSYRALVVQGSNGKRVALVKTDGYLASDLLTRRAVQILKQSGSAIGYDQIMQTASHNHSSPFYMSPSWGVWLFQDVFEIRVFEYHARQMAAAILEAERKLQPAKMGATTIRHTIFKGMIARSGIGDDGTPIGYPETYHKSDWTPFNGHSDDGVVVARFDNVETGAPIAVWVNHGQHPEGLDDYDLITADYLAPLERMVQRRTGAPLVYSQGDVGSAEGPSLNNRDETLPDGVRRAWAHTGHAQAERGARYLADSIVQAYEEIGRGGGQIPFTSDFPVGYVNGFVPLPVSHPYASVSNCRTETTVEGAPGSPILGLPDCERGGGRADKTNLLWENLKAHGIPLPEHYDAPSFAAVEETMRLHLQAFRLGEMVIASCACEAQMEIILNFETRSDKIQGNEHRGYDWSQWCEPVVAGQPEGDWHCKKYNSKDLANETEYDAPFPAARMARMKAQVNNPADGWDKVENALAANAEPSDPAKIWGNFSTGELNASDGYAIAVGVGHAGDYNGYTVSYREYMSYDHYRKALTCCGSHTADYMATRMTAMARALRSSDETMWKVPEEPLAPVGLVDEARLVAQAEAIGAASSAAYDEWWRALPNDAGPAAPLAQPASAVEHFGAAHFSWRGGSNAVDNPTVEVQRLVNGEWTDYADQTGEVQTMVTFPEGAEGVVNTYAGNQEWKWTASFEAYGGWPTPLGSVPFGDYRFVVNGKIRQGGEDVAYTFASDAFSVVPRTNIVPQSVSVSGGDVSLVVPDSVYPRTYTSPFRHIRDDGNQIICRTCTFRPWASRGAIASVTVTVERSGSNVVELVPATLVGGVWVADTNLQPGDVAYVAPGHIVDEYGEINGSQVTIV